MCLACRRIQPLSTEWDAALALLPTPLTLAAPSCPYRACQRYPLQRWGVVIVAVGIVAIGGT
eukprot:2275535-Heterocapsa_arctica.AAC.1